MKKIISSFFFSFFLLVFTHGLSQAQTCPPVPDNPAYPWNYGGTYPTTIAGCPAIVEYCYRSYPDPNPLNPGGMIWSYVVTSITPTASCGNNWNTVIKQASKQILIDNPQGFPRLLCPAAYTHVYEAALLTCWRLTNGQGNPRADACDANGWCVQDYYICRDAAGNTQIMGQSLRLQISGPCTGTIPLDVTINSYPYTVTDCLLIDNCDEG